MPEVLTFKIEDFEGPLDLLLYLVGKNKMNLYDVNIMELIEQYTAAIREMQQNRMEISSEFIDMAAHLVQMKSALLLPRSPEAERMKAELTGRLIEYSACKEVAAQLGSRARDLYTVAREPMPLVGAAEYTRRHDPNWLVQAWFNLMGRSTRKKKPTQEKFEPLVTAPFVSVASRVSHMLRGLLKGSLQKMGELLSHSSFTLLSCVGIIHIKFKGSAQASQQLSTPSKFSFIIQYLYTKVNKKMNCISSVH